MLAIVIHCGWNGSRRPRRCQHALRVAKQLGALGLGRRRRDLLVERVEGRVVIAEIVVGLGYLHEIERLDMRDDGEIEIVRAVAGKHLRQPLRPFDVLDLGDDAHLGELGCEDFPPCRA
jgi:hypothetical protein